MHRVRLLVLIVLVAGCRTGEADHLRNYTSVGKADPGFLEQYAATRRFTLGQPTGIKITPDGSAVLFLRSGPRTFVHDLYVFDTASQQERLLLTADQILKGGEEELSVEEKARRERMRMTSRGVTSFQLSEDGTLILVPLSGKLFVVRRDTGSISELPGEGGFPIDPKFSPDGRFVACARDGDLYVIDVSSVRQVRLTTKAGDHITNGVSEFVAQEEMGRFSGYWWSPDSRSIAYQETDTSGLEEFTILDALHPEKTANQFPYPRPGKANADVRLGVIGVDGGTTQWVEWDRGQSPYLATVRWEKNSPLTILVQNRRQTEERLLRVDPASGVVSELLVERDDAWINLDQKMPHWLEDGSGFLWTTERDGTMELERRAVDGRLLSRITPAQVGLKDFLSVDLARGIVSVQGSPDPTQTHVYQFPLDPKLGEAERLTDAPGVHQAAFAKNHETSVHTFTSLDGTRASVVRSADGMEIGRLRSLAEEPTFMPRLELTSVGEHPSFHAAIVRPRDFRGGRRYPVIVYVYGGPNSQVVTANPYAYLLQQWIADHGFIVVSVDGRGTPSRGREWERVIKGNLINLPLTDQVAGLQALGRKYREMDLNRVGIYGWSFGGYFSAMAVMQRPDVYHAGMAGAPVCDWLDYDTHYTERFMDLPEMNAAGYQAASVATHAPMLRRPLLIIHGTADDNVYFMHALKMSNALFRAGRAHEFLPLSDFTHIVADPLVTTRLWETIVGFFERELLN